MPSYGGGRRAAGRRPSAGRGRVGRRPGPPSSGEGGDEPPRASLWSVPEAHRRLYFGLFALLFPAGLGWNFWYAISGGPPTAGWRNTVQTILEDLPATGLGAALVAFFISELWRFTVVLGDWLEEKLNLKELKAQRAAEREEARKARESDLEEKLREIRERARTETPEEARKRMGNRAYNRMQREAYKRAAEQILEEEIQKMTPEEILREYLKYRK